MSTGYGVPCEKCGKAPFFRFETDGRGKVAETFLTGCDHEKTARRICLRCDGKIEGRTSRARYCTPCAPEAAKENARKGMRQSYAADPEKFRARRRAAYKRRGRKDANYMREYRAKNAERLKKDREKISLASHPTYEKRLASARAYYRKHRKRYVLVRRAYRARKRAEREAQQQGSAREAA